MGYLFIVVAPQNLKSKIGNQFGLSGIEQSLLDREVSSMYGDSLYQSDLDKAKENTVKAVMQRHRIKQGSEIEVRFLRDSRMPTGTDTDSYRSFAQKIAEEQNIGDKKYRWEFHKYETASVAFPVLAIWLPPEGTEVTSTKKWWQFLK